jgi:large subunit ribosomal protein L6
MSRIGKAPIQVPAKVKIDVQESNLITVEGPKGKLSQALPVEMEVLMEEGMLLVKRPSDSQAHRSLHGLTRALLNNMVVGVSEGFSKKLQIEGVGYRAEMNGETLVLNVGYSHPVYFEPPADVQYAVENRNKTIIVSGIDKQVVGELAAQIRKQRPPEPYKGKGIRYDNEVVRRKAGKTGKV